MLTSPYNIYVKNRPLKTAFLLDAKDGNADLDAAIRYSQEKWGGRFNPIILTDGRSFASGWWEILAAIDPDVVASFVPLEESILRQISRYLSPISVDVLGAESGTRHPSRTSQDGLSVLPTPENVARVTRSFLKPPTLVLFGLEKTCDQATRRFVEQNFGTYEPTLHIARAIEKCSTQSFTVGSQSDLATALTTLSQPEQYTYPVQISALPNVFPDAENARDNGPFTVFVGDELLDRAFAWNNIFALAEWKRFSLNQLWLPLDMAEDAEMAIALKPWLQRHADPGGTTTAMIRFVSSSVDQDRLRKIAKVLTEGTWLHTEVDVLSQPWVPTYYPMPFVRINEDMAFHRVVGAVPRISLKEPDVTEGVMGGQCWMADVYVQDWPQQGPFSAGSNRWLRLPRRNLLAHHIFQSASRITSERFPSALVRRGTSALSLRLPDPRSVLYPLLVLEDEPAFTGDPRKGLEEPAFAEVRRSDKGRYLEGFLGVFTDLSAAHQVLEERYWRRMFNVLSDQNPADDERAMEAVRNKLEKNKSKLVPPDMDWLAHYVLQLAKQQAAIGKQLPFSVFLREAEKEIQEFNQTQQGEPCSIEDRDVEDAVARLIETGVLRMGIRPRCPRCGLANWYEVEEARHELDCKGCGYRFPMRPRAEWYYRLNSLVQAGCSQHGLIPVVLVLGQLQAESRMSFMMTASLDLFSRKPETDEEAHVGDLDVVCIQDGQWIIGEIKQSVRLFKASDFSKMGDIAERIRPDRLLFSSLDKAPNRTVRDGILSLQARLAPQGIQVTWYQLNPSIFEAWPVR